MARPISLLLIPTGPGDNDPPEIYLDAGGVWRALGEMSLPPQKLPEARESFGKVLSDLSELLDLNPAAADDSSVRAEGADLFQRLLPGEVQQMLRAALAQAGADPPMLRIHAAHRYDWIPWELLYDDEQQHYVGLKFAVARLPIVSNPPEMPDKPRKVSGITSLLADGTLAAADPLVQKWRDTFNGLANGAIVTLRPAGAADWPKITAVGEGLKTDILHITCHGIRQNGEFFLNLSPNDPIPSMKALGPKQITAFARSLTAPLVFGNACNPPGGAKAPRLEPSGLGKAFFSKGALNIVSTLAPVSQTLAFSFACEFYKRLLDAAQPPIGQVILDTKLHFNGLGGNDPSYLFYSLYGPPETRFTH